MDAYSHGVREPPGYRRFRTGISLRVSFKEPSELPKLQTPVSPNLGSPGLSKPGSSEDRFILFVSFPYFGSPSQEITLDRERENLKLLDFKFLGVDARDRRVEVSEEDERASIGEILVHQARYIIFDNSKL